MAHYIVKVIDKDGRRRDGFRTLYQYSRRPLSTDYPGSYMARTGFGEFIRLARVFNTKAAATNSMKAAESTWQSSWHGEVLEIEIRIKDDDQETAFTRDAPPGRGGAQSQVSTREKVLL